MERSSITKYHEIHISFVTTRGAATLSLDGGIPTSVTLPRFTPLNNVTGTSQTILGSGGNAGLVGFGQTSQGCIRKFIVNGLAVDTQGLARCPLDRIDECSHEYCVNPDNEDCFKTTACDQDITSNFVQGSSGSSVSLLSNDNFYIHGFTVTATSPIQFQAWVLVLSDF